MISSEEYLKEKHAVIEHDYIENGYPANCVVFALEIANILLAEGKKPEIFTIEKGIFSRKLNPIQYKGKVRWNRQNVCCAEGFAYDPVIGKPVYVEDYSLIMFGRKFEMKRNEKMEKYIGYHRGICA